MDMTVEIPIWLVLVAGLLAMVGLVDRLLAPGMRWFVHRRVNRAIDELNTRLKLKIRPFGLTTRQVLIDRLTFDSEVVEAAEKYAVSEDMPVRMAMLHAADYARETVPSFNAYAYFRIGTRLARMISTALYRVRLVYSDEEGLEKIDPGSTVVFVMNHRSNMDYVLVTYLASASAALSYAVGEWARVAVLQNLIRSMGAYFVRRNSHNVLYRRVLARYVQMATEAGVTQAVFPEGGLSRDGRMRPVKLGLLSYIVAGYKPKSSHDIVFIPVGLNYDRVLEDRTLIAEAAKPAPAKKAAVGAVLKFLWQNLRLRMAGRWYRFGYACVSFGSPVSLREFMTDHWDNATGKPAEGSDLGDPVALLGERLISAIAAEVPVLPVSMVATELLEAGEAGLDLPTLRLRIDQLIDRFERCGAHVHIPRADRDYAVRAGLRMLELRHVVKLNEQGIYRIVPDERPLALFYANSIAHLAISA